MQEQRDRHSDEQYIVACEMRQTVFVSTLVADQDSIHPFELLRHGVMECVCTHTRKRVRHVNGTYVISSRRGSRVLEEGARLLEHELQLDELGVRAAKFVAVRVHLEKFTLQALELHLKLVEIEGPFE